MIFIITVKLGELRGIIEGLNEIMAKELPVKPAYWFGKLAKNIRKEVAEFEENRINLVKKYSVRDMAGEPVVEDGKYKIADQEAFGAAFKELAETEIEIDFNQVSLEQLGDVKISPIVMIGLEKFVGE